MLGVWKCSCCDKEGIDVTTLKCPACHVPRYKPDPNKWICLTCGNINYRDGRYCMSCGHMPEENRK